MIVIGISPGVRSLAYCVLFFPGSSVRPRVQDSDLLKGGKTKKKASESPQELRQKARPHSLVLDVVIGRAHEENQQMGLPTFVAVGPSVKNSHQSHDQIVRLILRQLVAQLRASGLAVEYVEWETTKELVQALGTEPRKAVRQAIGKALTKSEAFTLAAGAALAGQRRALQNSLPAASQKA